MNKKWEIYQTNEEKVEELQEKYKLNRLLSTLLTNRGIIEEAEITKFLNPKRSDFYDPFGMPDMEKAVERILKAIKDKEQIIIYGDYDVDGITSVTVLKSFLEERGIQINVYIPNRLNEGYGLNKTAIEEISKQGNKLMITVDCGITAVEEVEYAKKFGIIEKVLSEEKIGKKEFFNYIGKALCRELTELAKETDLVEKRYERFRKIGADAKTREQMKL